MVLPWEEVQKGQESLRCVLELSGGGGRAGDTEKTGQADCKGALGPYAQLSSHGRPFSLCCHTAEMSCETGLLVILLLMTLQVLIDLPFYS